MNLKTEVYLNIAKECAKLSKDENTKVGCCIVDIEGRIVSTGRNGSVSGIIDSLIPYSRDEKTLYYVEHSNNIKGRTKHINFKSNKYPFMIHSEANAIMATDDRKRLVGSTIYVSGLPCSNCALMIAQSEIAKVVIPKNYDIKMMDEKQINYSKYILLVSRVELFVEDEKVNLDYDYDALN